MRLLNVLPALLLLGFAPASAASQSLPDLLRSIQQGGGWVRIPVERGEGDLRTVSLPIGGLGLRGCLQVWGGHSGSWDIRAKDLWGEGDLDVSVHPGESTPFAYYPDTRAQLQVNVRWSEPRDTTLLLWVGLETPRLQRDPCDPRYGSG